MAIQYPEMTAQEGVYYSASGGYVDVDNTFDPLTSDFKTFAVEASASSWADGDEVRVYIWASTGNSAIWNATWDAANEYLELESLEEAKGTLVNGGAVEVTATATNATFTEGTSDEWILSEEIDFDGTVVQYDIPIPFTASVVRVVFSDVTSVTDGTFYIYTLLDDVFDGLANIVWTSHANIEGNSVPTTSQGTTRNIFALHALLTTGTNHLSGEVFFYNVKSQDQFQVVADVVFEEHTTGKIATYHFIGIRPSTGKDVTALRFGCYDWNTSTGRNITGLVKLYYKA